MRQKLLIITMFISAIVINSSCKKDVKDIATTTSENAQKTTVSQDLKNAALQSRAMIEKIDQQIKETMPVIRQTIENLQLEHSQRLATAGQMGNSTAKKTVINVPGDYTTLQEAVNNAAENGKISVKGAVTDLGDVLVNVSGLTIQGEGNAPIINGSKLIILASGITVKNLTINMGIIISGTSNETLINNKINSMINIASSNFFGIPLDQSVLIDQSTNCTLKNNEIKVTDAYIGIHFGILMNEGSGHTITSNNVSFDLMLDYNNYFESIHGSVSNNNKISNCILSNNISFNSGINSFGIYLQGSGNEVSNCRAANVSGPFVVFGDNNKINNCNGSVFKWSGFEANGNNNQIKNCKADGNLIGNYSYGNFGLRGFASFYGMNNIFDNCEAKNNEVGLELALDVNFGTNFLSGNQVSNCNLYSNNSYGVFLYKSTLSTLQKNNTNLNRIVGINLVEVSNSSILNNTSSNNTTSDFNQTNCTSNKLTSNKFTTSTEALPWVGPF